MKHFSQRQEHDQQQKQKQQQKLKLTIKSSLVFTWCGEKNKPPQSYSSHNPLSFFLDKLVREHKEVFSTLINIVSDI